MTKEEASIYLALPDAEDVADAIEACLFQSKQELIQKADQVLLFAAKEKKFHLLQEAGLTLGFVFPTNLSIDIAALDFDSMESAFQSFHQVRSNILRQLNQTASFHGLIAIQQALFRNHQEWTKYWRQVRLPLIETEVKISSVIDPMRFLQWILHLKEQGITRLSELQESQIPSDIQHEICRLQKLHERFQ
ncbi:MAG: hypothetical protein ACKOXP_04975 [Flavobacteriales bacterium]